MGDAGLCPELLTLKDYSLFAEMACIGIRLYTNHQYCLRAMLRGLRGEFRPILDEVYILHGDLCKCFSQEGQRGLEVKRPPGNQEVGGLNPAAGTKNAN